MMGFIHKVAAKPDELVPDVVTGNLPTGKPTPKVAAQAVWVVVLTAAAPIVTGVLAKRNIRLDPGELIGLVTALVGGAAAITTAIGYLKRSKAPVKVPDSAT
jgi:hypothetical protein